METWNKVGLLLLQFGGAFRLGASALRGLRLSKPVCKFPSTVQHLHLQFHPPALSLKTLDMLPDATLWVDALTTARAFDGTLPGLSWDFSRDEFNGLVEEY